MSEKYDHIRDYLTDRIHDPNAPEVRNLIADFALLWNQYERTIYESDHHIYNIKNTIKKFYLDDMDNISNLYERLKKYVVDIRENEYTYDGLKVMFNIKIKELYFDEKKQKNKFTPGDILKEDLEMMVRGNNNYEKTYCLLVIAAKVRNNMFHGTKGPWELPEQKELFRICNELLMSVLEKAKTKDI